MSVRGFVVSFFAALALLLVPAAGASAAPQLSTPTGLNKFGDVFLGDTATKVFTYTSTGSSPVTIGESSIFEFAGNSEYFSITNDACVGKTRATGQTCQVTVEFKPTVIGFKYTSMSVTSDDPASPHFFGIDGTGVDPGIDVTPASHDFGNVEVGSYGSAKTFTIKSDGTTDLDANPTITGTDADEFFFETQPNCVSMPPDSTCSVTVNLRPLDAPGTRSANLVIGNNTKTENPVTIPLTAKATQGKLSTDPASLDFGEVDAYTDQGPSQTVTLSNDGDAALTIFDLDMHEGKANSYTLNPDECVDDLVLSPGDDCSLNVTFKADSVLAGANDSAISIYTSVGGETVPVTATLIEGDMSASPQDLDVGQVELGQSGTATLNLYSTGTAPLIFSPETPTLGGSDAAMFEVNLPASCEGLTDDGSSCPVEVTFTPTSLAGKSASARFEGNFGTLDVSLSGTGIEAFVNAPTGVDFPETIVGSDNSSAEFLLSNGDEPFSLGSMEIQGADASLFAVQPDGECQALVRGEECPFTVTYSPTSAGAHSAELKVTGNIETLTIPLTGTARNLIPATVGLKLTGPAKAKRGKVLLVKARISVKGETMTGPLTLRTSVPKGLAAKVKPIKLASMAPGKVVTKSIRIKVKKKAKKGKKLKLAVTASGSSVKTVKAVKTVKVR